MKLRIIRWLTWCLRSLGQRVMTVDVTFEAYLDTALNLVILYERTALPGEGRRHQVYSLLRKSYPGADGVHLSLAIEFAMMQIQGRDVSS